MRGAAPTRSGWRSRGGPGLKTQSLRFRPGQAHVRGPQIITRHGAERAVVLSVADYRALVAHKPYLIEYLLGGPKVEGFDIEPSHDMSREIELWAGRFPIASTPTFTARPASGNPTLAVRGAAESAALAHPSPESIW